MFKTSNKFLFLFLPKLSEHSSENVVGASHIQRNCLDFRPYFFFSRFHLLSFASIHSFFLLWCCFLRRFLVFSFFTILCCNLLRLGWDGDIRVAHEIQYRRSVDFKCLRFVSMRTNGIVLVCMHRQWKCLLKTFFLESICYFP